MTKVHLEEKSENKLNSNGLKEIQCIQQFLQNLFSLETLGLEMDFISFHRKLSDNCVMLMHNREVKIIINDGKINMDIK